MSSRWFRRICGTSLPPHDSDDSDGNFEPLYVQQRAQSSFEGLELGSDSEQGAPRVAEADEETLKAVSLQCGGARKKQTQKIKGKGKKKFGRFARNGNTSISRAESEELDEVDRSVMEVNALLGPPMAIPRPKSPDEMEIIRRILFEVSPKNLNAGIEVTRLLGPEDPSEVKEMDKIAPYRAKILKKVMIKPRPGTLLYNFTKAGLTMSILKREDDITYFVYDHNLDHQTLHSEYLIRYVCNNNSVDTSLIDLKTALKEMHVEPILEIVDTLYEGKNDDLANELTENLLVYLQFVAHPMFSLSSTKVRLLYTYLENRPFHVVLLRAVYVLTQKACHRTALEIAKVLLNLDPEDPLAVVLIIDVVALRAREHKFLICLIKYLMKTEKITLKGSILYSFALAHFHVAINSKKDVTVADEYLQRAILMCPFVAFAILDSMHVYDPRVLNNELFSQVPTAAASKEIRELIILYSKMSGAQWQEPLVFRWFMRNVIDIAEKFVTREMLPSQLIDEQTRIYEVRPVSFLRHLIVIKSMAKVILNKKLSINSRSFSSFDPLFDDGINRYNYYHPELPKE